MANIKKGDTVYVIAGREKTKQGKVQRVLPKEKRLFVEGLNFVKRHQKAMGVARQAGIIDKEAPLPISNVMLVCPSCGRPTRVGHEISEDGRKLRACKKCEGVFE